MTYATRTQLANFLAGAILDQPRKGPARDTLHELVRRLEAVAGWSDFATEVAEEAQDILANRDDTIAAPAPWSYRPPRPVLDRDRLESDRYLVLLACGHWAHTRGPDHDTFPCPVLEPLEERHGLQPPALTDDGHRAILTSWDLLEAPCTSPTNHSGVSRDEWHNGLHVPGCTWAEPAAADSYRHNDQDQAAAAEGLSDVLDVDDAAS